MTNSNDAAAALDAMQATRMKLAAASDAPPSRHLAFAALEAALVAAPALPFLVRIVVIVCALAAIPAIIRWDRRRTGMFISGYRAGRTRRVLAVLLLAILSLYLLSTWLAFDRHSVWGPLALAALTGVVAYFGSIWWCRVFRQEMMDAL